MEIKRNGSQPSTKGATDHFTDTAMTHIAIQEYLEGRAADWMEHVSDEQYVKLNSQGARI